MSAALPSEICLHRSPGPPPPVQTTLPSPALLLLLIIIPPGHVVLQASIRLCRRLGQRSIQTLPSTLFDTGTPSKTHPSQSLLLDSALPLTVPPTSLPGADFIYSIILSTAPQFPLPLAPFIPFETILPAPTAPLR
ncbi:unnamed protein product [Zymoseptoria tritici ST99CH_1A5]|uniref:Uncharacterized protein n=3 Tax=Zymoseptoria tritici TaxID=1047171 RepID=A0A1X7REB6_ZYMT9|nr:unnamed protein product [Zymoseptoria tritici ST99CH_3D7]SMR42104.1 unnamed protein product [Zymoseptoria tritici ST99CH_1E4]SMY19440.1 unnamed protein product [Zymoseptoria tritici ST99CH_1A5]